MAKKRVLFFVEAMGGGVFTYITNLANELSKEFDVYVAYATRPQTPKNYKEYFNKNVRLIKVKNFERKISFKDVKAFFEIRRIFKLVKPDIVHLHSSKAGILGRWAFNGRKIPLFYTPHGYSFLMSDISPQKEKLYRTLEKISASRNSITISCSYGENKETKKITKRALYVDNGINIEKIDKAISNEKRKQNKKPVIFTIGRISFQKDPILFNKIAEHFKDFKFVWIGDGKLRNKLTSPNIEVIGWRTEEEVLKLANNYDIFLLPSKWEGLPMSLLEAMYLKKICVVSNVIGNNNVITNNRNGFLCNNLSDYINIITKLVNKGVPDSLVENAKNDIVQHYNSTAMAKQYAAIYRKALNEK